MIFRIVNEDGTIAMSLDYPEDSPIPAMYLKEGQSLFSAPEDARLHLQDDKLMVVDRVVRQAFLGPVQEPFNGDGEQLTPVDLSDPPIDQYLAVPALSDDKT